MLKQQWSKSNKASEDLNEQYQAIKMVCEELNQKLQIES